MSTRNLFLICATVMVNAAMAEARRLDLNIAESDMHKLLQAALNKG